MPFSPSAGDEGIQVTNARANIAINHIRTVVSLFIATWFRRANLSQFRMGIHRARRPAAIGKEQKCPDPVVEDFKNRQTDGVTANITGSIVHARRGAPVLQELTGPSFGQIRFVQGPVPFIGVSSIEGDLFTTPILPILP
jgi:hypothetical protein